MGFVDPENGLAKIEVIETTHGRIETPALIPVVAASYGVWDLWIEGKFPAPWEKASSVILSLYHILQYPRKERILEEGIHRVLRTDRPVIIDSGGFQYMKKGRTLDPLSVLEYQRKCGCDIGITFDYPIPPTIEEEEKRRRIEETIESANLTLTHHDGTFLLYAAIHGSDAEEILQCRRALASGFDGYGIGSLVPKKSHYEHLVDLIYAARNSTEKPLHCFGITGFPALFALSYLGVNTFDSWTYVVAAAFKEYIHPDKLNRVKLRKSDIPDCDCTICMEYGKREFLEPTSSSEVLLSLHNLEIFMRENQNLREAIGKTNLKTYIEKRGEKNKMIKKAFGLAQKKLKDARE